MENLLETVTPKGRIILQAFADGMNAWIQEAADTGQLPIIYQEKVVDGQYLFDGEDIDFDCRDETINVR